MKRLISIITGIASLLFVFQAGYLRAGDSQEVRDSKQTDPIVEYVNAMVTNYIELKNGLVNGNNRQVIRETAEFRMYLQELKVPSLKAVSKRKWVDQKIELINILEQISETTEIKHQRRLFATLTYGMETLIDRYGPVKQTLFKQYCPDALDGRGGYWFNEKKEILNPYGGRDRLHCGEVTEVIRGRDS